MSQTNEHLTQNVEYNKEESPQTVPKQNTKSFIEEHQFTFKIIKRRSPWNKKEDQAIIDLVNKFGTGNWTLIANEMASSYGFKSRSGKQCRERWHNHLDPKVSKDNWTEKEETILLAKHMEFGNKWSDIAKYLPGRTDNAIKNHFYSKFRKYIRKILKQINKENLMKQNGIDANLYNGDKIYKLLKKYKIAYKNLNKDTILNLIVTVDKNNNNTDSELNSQFLKNKTKRNKTNTTNNYSNNCWTNHNLHQDSKHFDNDDDCSKSNSNEENENSVLSDKEEEVNKKIPRRSFPVPLVKKRKRIKSEEKKTKKTNFNKVGNKKKGKHYLDFLNDEQPPKKRRKSKRRKVSICLSTPENKRVQVDRIIPSRKGLFSKPERTSKRKKQLKEDLNPCMNGNVEIVRPGLEIVDNQYIIISKSLIMDYTSTIDFSQGQPSKTRYPQHFLFNNIPYDFNQRDFGTPQMFPRNKNMNDITLTFSQDAQMNTVNGPGQININITTNINPNINPTPHYNGPIDDSKYYSYFDNQPQMSPMNLNTMVLYPQSTRNLFNLDISSMYDNNLGNQSSNIFKMQTQNNNTYNNNFSSNNNTYVGNSNAKQGQLGIFPLSTTNRDLSLKNRILVTSEMKKNTNTYDIKEDSNFEFGTDNLNGFMNNSRKPQIDLTLVNQSETNAIFLESLCPINKPVNNINGGMSTTNNNATANIFDLSPNSAFLPSNTKFI